MVEELTMRNPSRKQSTRATEQAETSIDRAIDAVFGKVEKSIEEIAIQSAQESFRKHRHQLVEGVSSGVNPKTN